MEKGKVLRNLEKLALRDFEFINAGRIAVVANTKEITTDLVKKNLFRTKYKSITNK